MPLFQGLFRPSKPKSYLPRPIWPRLRRSKGVVVQLDDPQSEPILTTGNAAANQVELVEPEQTDGAADTHEEEWAPGQDAHSQHERQPSTDSQPARHDSDASQLSRSQHGSKRLKNFVARLRGSKSEDRGSLVSLKGALHQTGPEEAKDVKEEKVARVAPPDTDPNENAHPQDPSAVEQEGNEQNRKVSAQTVCSHESKDTTVTVCRRPSQRIPMPVQEVQEDWFWPELLSFTRDTAHRPEVSDPFSDGKNADMPEPTRTSSKRSEQSQIQSEPSLEQSGHRKTESSQRPSSKSHCSSCPLSTQRTSSGGSQASRSSRLGRLNPAKATVAFNLLAAKLNLPLSISVDDATAAGADEKPTPEEENMPRQRHRFLRRVRPVQSNLTLEVDSQPPVPKLRRTKTFANFTRRPSPMSSLRGKSVETLARLGGHSFIILPADLAPSPLQLPACIVAPVMYLRKFAPSTAELFVEPGDIKAATSLYDHFASQVLSAEKDEPKIALTMRVIALPQWEMDARPGFVLSVGWALKALLAGLPGGILGSARLYEALKAIYFAETPPPARVRLITLAIVALTSEMQCALICAVFGLLTGLLQESESSQDHEPTGNSLRRVASLTDSDRLARVFGPLLIGMKVGDRAAQLKVEQEVEEQRVAGLLLEHWGGVSRQLREWASGYTQGEKRD